MLQGNSPQRVGLVDVDDGANRQDERWEACHWPGTSFGDGEVMTPLLVLRVLLILSVCLLWRQHYVEGRS